MNKKEQKVLIREAGELFGQMDFLLASLLKLSRLDAGIVVFKKEHIDIRNLVLFSLRPFLISMELHNIQIQTDIPEDTEISGDFRWLSEAFLNIVSIKAEVRIPVGEYLCLSIGHREANGNILTQHDPYTSGEILHTVEEFWVWRGCWLLKISGGTNAVTVV